MLKSKLVTKMKWIIDLLRHLINVIEYKKLYKCYRPETAKEQIEKIQYLAE